MEKIVYQERISIRPNRVSTTIERRVQIKNEFGFWVDRPKINFQSSVASPSVHQAEASTLQKKFHDFKISPNSARNLRDKIEYLFQFAKARKVKTLAGNQIVNFKCAFITLTLPAKQKHPTALISEICLDDILQKMRKVLNMRNYVWRMEFQGNGNVHYHLVTDTYVDFLWLQKEWNKSVQKLGYIADYQAKMSNLSFSDYCENYSQGGKIGKDLLYKRYVKGRAMNWSQPNSVDVKNAKASDSVGYYISKYFSKKEKKTMKNALDNEINSFALRLCFWSRSLSRIKTECMPLDYFVNDFRKWLKNEDGAKELVFDYARVIYYDFVKLGGSMKALIGSYFRRVMEQAQYMPMLE